MWSVLLGAAALGALAAASACGGSSNQPSASSNANDGWANIQFQLPSGTVTKASYTITGPNGFSKSDTIDAADDAGNGVQEIAFLVESLPPGSGYMLNIMGSNQSGEMCSGAQSFDVTPQQGAPVNVPANCTGAPYVPDGYGSVEVWATLPSGLSFSNVGVLLDGPAGNEANTMVAVAASSSGTSVHFTLKMVPAGTGQVLRLTAVTTDGSKTCIANSSFDVVANMQAEVTVSSFDCNTSPNASDN